MKIHVSNGRLIDPRNGVDRVADVFIAAGRVAAVGEAPEGFHANRVIDATGLVVCPGLVDLSVRLREPGFEYRATLESEMAAAVAGGVTSIACPPDTDPTLDEPGLVEMLKFRARSLNMAHLYPLGALTMKLAGERLTEMAELRDAGCVAFSQADAPIVDTTVLLRAMQYAATFDLPVWLPPMDPHLSRGGVAHDSEVATRLGLSAIPGCAEVVALSTILHLVRESGARVHVRRVTSREAVQMMAAAKAEGLPVSCDVSINHLHLSDLDLGYFDSNCRLVPPLRGARDRDALRAGLAQGAIDALCSDHTPVDEDAKQVPFGEAEPGATGVELLLPLALKWGREAGVALPAVIERITSRPAALLGIDAGHLAPGAVADLCILDPQAPWRVEPATLKSQGKNTPFLGYEMEGRVRCTLVTGHVVHEA